MSALEDRLVQLEQFLVKLEREADSFRKFKADTCAARHPMAKPEREEGAMFADMQHCFGCGVWSRIGEPFECPFGWDR